MHAYVSTLISFFRFLLVSNVLMVPKVLLEFSTNLSLFPDVNRYYVVLCIGISMYIVSDRLYDKNHHAMTTIIL